MSDTSSTSQDESPTDRPCERTLVVLLRVGAFLCLAGWTWVHLYWEAPYGVLIWQETTFEVAESYGMNWDQFVGTTAGEGLVQRWLSRIGWLYLCCTMLTLTVYRGAWLQIAGLVTGTLLLAILFYAKYVSAQRQLPMFVEHGGQMLMPLILGLALTFGARHRITIVTAMTAVVMTFAGHGSYALGLWPTPANFYAMTSVILSVEYETAKMILRAAGILDFLVCIGILVPQLRRASMLYAATWGLLTSIARPMAGMGWELYYYGADQYIHEAVLRTPHWILPLYLFFAWRAPEKVFDTFSSRT